MLIIPLIFLKQFLDISKTHILYCWKEYLLEEVFESIQIDIEYPDLGINFANFSGQIAHQNQTIYHFVKKHTLEDITTSDPAYSLAVGLTPKKDLLINSRQTAVLKAKLASKGDSCYTYTGV